MAKQGKDEVGGSQKPKITIACFLPRNHDDDFSKDDGEDLVVGPLGDVFPPVCSIGARGRFSRFEVRLGNWWFRAFFLQLFVLFRKY